MIPQDVLDDLDNLPDMIGWSSGKRNGIVEHFIRRLLDPEIIAEAQKDKIARILAKPMGTTPYWIKKIMDDMDRIRMNYIIMTLAEGPTHLCGKPVVVHTWSDATKVASRWLPFLHKSFHKVDFDVTFNDGMEYVSHAGTFQICPGEFASLSEHIRHYHEGLIDGSLHVYSTEESRQISRDFLNTYSLLDYEPYQKA